MKKLLHLFLIVCMIGIMSISSFASDGYVYDDAGLLSYEEWLDLETKAAAVAKNHGCGVYLITVDDYRDYSNGDVFETAIDLYHGMKLGEGANREGILLLLSMDDRDYATFFYGSQVEYAFDAYGQMKMEDEFLDDLGNNAWYYGLNDFISVCDEYLTLAEQGSPVRESFGFLYLIVIGVSVVIAVIVTFGLRMSMMSVHKGGSTAVYAVGRGLNLTAKRDYFLYNTQTRRKIERSSSSSGSGSRSGGGGSGRSGKF